MLYNEVGLEQKRERILPFTRPARQTARAWGSCRQEQAVWFQGPAVLW